MSFECPYLDRGKCKLNNYNCTPGKGKCVLRSRYVMPNRENEKKDKADRINQKREK